MKMTRRQAGYDRCRALGHAWYEIDADRTPPFGFYMWLKCESCDTIRKDIVTRWGDMLSRQYDYPEDYADHEGHTRTDFRARLLAPRLPANLPTEERNIDALKERLRAARAAAVETTATEAVRPSAPVAARAKSQVKKRRAAA